MFLLLLILACAAPASSRAKGLSTGTFRDPLEKWGSTREENCRKEMKQQWHKVFRLKLGDSGVACLEPGFLLQNFFSQAERQKFETENQGSSLALGKIQDLTTDEGS